MSGSHRSLMEKQDGENHALKADVMLAVDATGKAGDVLLFTCYTAHHSFSNRSERERRALLYTYSPASERDTYSVYKGAHGARCREWLASHATAEGPPTGGSTGVPQRLHGYSDHDPRLGGVTGTGRGCRASL